MPCAPNRIPPDGTQRPLHPRSLRQHVALVRPRVRRHSLPRRGRTRRRRPRRLVYDTRPCPSARGCRFEAGDRSRREFPSRRRPRACEELARSRAREHCRDPARSGSRGRTSSADGRGAGGTSSASRALARQSSPTASSGARARTRSGKAGRRSAESSSALSTPGPTPRSRAARSTPTSRRNTSSERSGRL